MLAQLLHLAPDSDDSLQTQIRTQIVNVILNRQLPTDQALPSSRALAAQLGVARNTVVAAYERLQEEGYLLSRERSGYFVNPEVIGQDLAHGDVQQVPVSQPDWAQRLKVRPSAHRNIVKPGNWQDYPFPFTYGQPDYELFPTNHWRECCRDAMSIAAIKAWATEQLERDDDLLVEQILSRLLPRRGIGARPENILITVGAQQALYLLMRLLVNKTTTVGLENPGYVDVRNIALLNRGNLKALAVDAGGLVVNAELDDCDCVYVTPSHQSPTTVTMPIERRYQLLQHSVEHDTVVIEDDYESEINFAEHPTPALKSLDHNGRVIYVGSLSKTLAPGLRMGYVVADKPLIDELRALRRLMIRHPASNNQRAVGLFLARGYHDRLTRQMVSAYRKRCEVMTTALEQLMPGAARSPAFGGSSIWVEGPAGLDADLLGQQARAEGIIIEPGAVHFLQTNPPRNFFRLGFSSLPAERIEEGIRRLAKLVGTYTNLDE